MRRVSLLILFVLLGPGAIIAQNRSGKSFDFRLSTGVSVAKGYEEQFSADFQDGNLWNTGTMIQRKGNRTIQVGTINYSRGTFQYLLNKSVTVARESFTANLGNAWRIGTGSETGLAIYGGLNLGIIHTTRSYSGLLNYNNSFETILPLDLLAVLTYTFDQEYPLEIYNRTHLAIAGIYRQPPFGNIGAGGNDLGKWVWGGFTQIGRLSNNTFVDWKLNTNHSIGAGYQFDFYRLATQREVRYLEHCFSISYKLKL